jgi:signal transduction histidine kinase/HPt (histidine-containing phosphotransfer) domain-containing protein/ActR/RegA family two-component response regulator
MASFLPPFLRQIGYVLLERRGVNQFALLSPPTPWFTELWPASNGACAPFSLAENSPFLESFLEEAEAFWQVPETGIAQSGTWLEQTAEHGEIPLEATALYLDGKPMLTIHSAGAEYREQVQVLQTARNSILEHERLLREIQKKEILLHCIVHDLSQPLSAMRGSFDCLATENDAGRIAKYIDLGKHASEQQEAMIRDILKAFSAELQDSIDTESNASTAPDLLLIATEALASLAPAFEAKGVRLALKEQIDATTNWNVRGEKTRLLRVFSNLLENALRYTPTGSGVTIGIEEDGGFLKAYIDDEGPGLPADLRPAQIFSLFGKAKENGGKAGLGLYFCRITVERWGGTIGCASLTEKGSRFWFRLPRAFTAAASTPEKPEKKVVPGMLEPKTMPGENRSPLSILLADDQEDIRTLTTHQLHRSGHEVLAVADGQAALESARAKYFDVILLDEEMPGLNGVQVVNAIRELQKGEDRRSILVALTGNNTPEDKDRLLAAGFDSVLGKPFRMESLNAFLRDPATAVDSGDTYQRRGDSLNAGLDTVLQRVGGDEKLLRQMIRTFLRETPARLAVIQKALVRKNGADLSASAHALKGSVSIFGALRAAQHTQSLQDLGRMGDFQEANRVFGFLQEEIAELQQNLRGYANQKETSPPASRAKEKKSKSTRTKARKSKR